MLYFILFYAITCILFYLFPPNTYYLLPYFHILFLLTLLFHFLSGFYLNFYSINNYDYLSSLLFLVVSCFSYFTFFHLPLNIFLPFYYLYFLNLYHYSSCPLLLTPIYFCYNIFSCYITFPFPCFPFQPNIFSSNCLTFSSNLFLESHCSNFSNF